MGKVRIKFILSVGLLIIAYIPTLAWMIDRWMQKESYYGHGFLIPLVSLFIVWQRRSILRETMVNGRWSMAPSGGFALNSLGLWVVGFALLAHIVCAALRVYFVSGFTFIAALSGLILFFFGKEILRKLTFPLFFLATMIPLPLVLIGNLTVRLKLFATEAATFILNRIGFPSVHDGNVIIMPHSHIIIEAPCSGLRSLISLLTLGLIFAYAMKMPMWKKAVLFLSSIPIAVATNIIRILLLAIVNDLYGEKIAMGFFHDASGFLLFAIAFLMLYGVGNILKGQQQ